MSFLGILPEKELLVCTRRFICVWSFKETIMGRAVDLFVTYRFLKLLTTPFNKTDAFKFGIIDKDGNRIKNEDGSVEVLRTPDEKGAYTILHKLIFNIQKTVCKSAWPQN